MNKESVGSLTVHFESVMTNLAIYAHEGRGIITVNIGGAFLLSKIVDIVLVQVEGEMVKVMCKANQVIRIMW